MLVCIIKLLTKCRVLGSKKKRLVFDKDKENLLLQIRREIGGFEEIDLVFKQELGKLWLCLKKGNDMFRIFHSAMIAYFLVIVAGVILSGAIAGCGYKAKPYYEANQQDTHTQHTTQDSQNQGIQSIKSIHSSSLSEDEGD